MTSLSFLVAAYALLSHVKKGECGGFLPEEAVSLLGVMVI
mgnify:FL=1